MELELLDENERKLNNLTLAVYILQAVSLLVGVTGIVAVIINYVKRDDVRGTLYESHFEWQIRTFWLALLGYVIGAVLTWLLVGFVILFAVWVWYIYRVVKGFLYFNDRKPLPLQ
ncbi:DUF4870 family protein [Chromobacterium amazonense]|uniref:Transmembrane protein n=1 Tax=Chromobacterium amazonense TaxID=1382803 RepID=A0A2S9X1L1_9NEIS|nr:membrane protein [Chromobacterium amazonense]KIA79763.1 membrane protein [Chromobacterium piscinae]MDQ4542668.1 hypothetical protein [Chromobacterium amazonense]PRP69609.1 hypothetical protein BUE93_17750 [Chromobacterium amazonense]